MTKGIDKRTDKSGRPIPELLAEDGPSFSFEFMPPRSERAEAVLWNSVRRLEQLHPTFVSVTYGAGGSTRDRTVRITGRIEQETTLRTMAHLTCVGSSVAELRRVVGEYASVGIGNILALRGDPPGGPAAPWVAHPEGLDHADKLVSLVRSLGDFTVGVAAFPDKHPESASLDDEAETLVRKADAGAAFAITQMVTDVDAYLRLRDMVDARGCAMPVIPGLLPVTAVGQLQRLTELNGQPLAEDVVSRIEAAGEDLAAVRREGIAICTEHSERLLREGAPGLHFMTMNKSTATLEVFANLRQSSLVSPAPDGTRGSSALSVAAANLGHIEQRFDFSPRGGRMRSPVHPTSPTPVAGTVLDLIDRTRIGLLQACHAETTDERYRLAHLAALRAAAAVLAADARRTPGSRPRNVWAVLPSVAPELAEWAQFFEGTARRRSELDRGAVAVSTREADDLVRQVETFLELVLVHLGLPMGDSFTACVAPTGGG